MNKLNFRRQKVDNNMCRSNTVLVLLINDFKAFVLITTPNVHNII